jgi:mRNA-degrading endonuclease YafQ of YafQ-DinJ toxin-antitoxin module
MRIYLRTRGRILYQFFRDIQKIKKNKNIMDVLNYLLATIINKPCLFPWPPRVHSIKTFLYTYVQRQSPDYKT